MFGLVLADNVILLFIFWELTSITSFLLIGFDYERERARWAATQARLTTGDHPNLLHVRELRHTARAHNVVNNGPSAFETEGTGVTHFSEDTNSGPVIG